MRRLGLAVTTVGVVFFVCGIAAVAWAADQADAMSDEDRALDPEQYDFYVSAQGCCLGCAVIGLMTMTIGALLGRYPKRRE